MAVQIFLRNYITQGDSIELLVEYIAPNMSNVIRTYKFRDNLTSTELANFIRTLADNTNALLTRADSISLLLNQDIVAYLNNGVADPNIKGILVAVHRDIDSVILDINIEPAGYPSFVKSITCMNAEQIAAATLDALVLSEANRIKNLLTGASTLLDPLLNTDLVTWAG